MLEKLSFIFAISFLLNLVWENLHARLYVHYKGRKITEWVLLHATLADAIFITVGGFLCMTIPYLQNHLWISIIMGVILAVGIEKWALATGRWSYNDRMPILPLIKTGLTPTIQLGILGYATLLIVGM